MGSKFFEELSRCLGKEQIESLSKEDRRLEIFLHGQPVLSVSPGNEVFMLPSGSKNPEANELYHRVAIAADRVFEYVEAKKNYGAEGAEVIVDNCQVNLYGGFAPASQTAVELSKALGSRTVMSGSISRGKNDPSQSLQMIERPLMTPDELKSMPKGSFIVAKTGVHPMKVKLRLFLDWGIRFGEPYEVPEKAQRAVAYADKQELEESIIRRHYGTVAEEEPPQDVPAAVGGMNHGISI